MFSYKPPNLPVVSEDRLKYGFERGLTSNIKFSKLDMRKVILKRNSEQAGVEFFG